MRKIRRGQAWARRTARLAVCCSLLSAASGASAQSGDLEAQLQEGIELQKGGADRAALKVFLEAEQLAPNSVRVLMHIVSSSQAAGEWLQARRYLDKVAEYKQDAYYRKHRALIERMRDIVDARVGRFQALGEPAGAEVRLDGELLGTLPMVEWTFVESGDYVLEVTKPGFYRLSRRVSVVGRSLTRESVDLNEVRPSSPSLTASLARGGGPGLDAGEKGWFEARWVTWTFAGLAGASAIGSGVAGLIREDQAGKWNDNERCLSNQVLPPGNGETEGVLPTRGVTCPNYRRNANRAESVAIATGVTAGVLGTAALAHWLTTRRHADSKQGEENARLSCAPGLMSVYCQGSF